MAIRVKEAELAAPALHVTLLSPELRKPDDFHNVFAALTRAPPGRPFDFCGSVHRATSATDHRVRGDDTSAGYLRGPSLCRSRRPGVLWPQRPGQLPARRYVCG